MHFKEERETYPLELRTMGRDKFLHCNGREINYCIGVQSIIFPDRSEKQEKT
jgi:hypothetical protein